MSSYSNDGGNVQESTVTNVQPSSTADTAQPSESPVTTQQPNTGSRLNQTGHCYVIHYESLILFIHNIPDLILQ